MEKRANPATIERVERVAKVSYHFVIMVAKVLYILGYHLLRMIGFVAIGAWFLMMMSR